MLKKIYKLGELTLMKKYREQELEKHTLIDLFWECTLTCNASCKHCGSKAENKQYDGELTTEEIKNAFKQIASDMDASKILINVTGGEPLVREDLWGLNLVEIMDLIPIKAMNLEVVEIEIRIPLVKRAALILGAP